MLLHFFSNHQIVWQGQASEKINKDGTASGKIVPCSMLRSRPTFTIFNSMRCNTQMCMIRISNVFLESSGHFWQEGREGWFSSQALGKCRTSNLTILDFNWIPAGIFTKTTTVFYQNFAMVNRIWLISVAGKADRVSSVSASACHIGGPNSVSLRK